MNKKNGQERNFEMTKHNCIFIACTLIDYENSDSENI